ncbi:hypothetical protein PFICI_10262 [Pestalotiopsis fici W106-1]|uniref:Smr domain-containing protein n=1 Tax=Pestalotiopsis fici (strain W106-1 / CGMCC3.15140) TaxID=1229662 RepID=W3WWH3_PESFW|nr:uncharacterized protein PFICI_10262 [Pestalotiopsis fici W106-1]ETS78200.1 hypothetical protein PFICI_10262 [Pestalotiopsis fici W106-1]
MGEPLQRLINEFSSLVDEALILSLCSDFDLNIASEFQQARQALIVVSADVPLEEASGFNASGLGDRVIDINGNPQAEPSEAGTALSGSDTRSPDGVTTPSERSLPQTILSTGSSHTSFQESQGPTRFSLYDGLTFEEKEIKLREVFTELKPIDITLALRKFDGDADRAVDVLLTTSHLEQSGQRPKGIDGFYVDDEDAVLVKKKKKGKKKKPAVRGTNSPDPSAQSNLGEPATAEVHERNIRYLADRLPFSESEVEYVYCEKRQSMGAALVQILDNYIAIDGEALAKARNSASDDQGKKYPWVPVMYLTPTFCLATSRQNAEDLVQILAEYYEKPAYLRYNISYNISGPKLELVTTDSSSSKTWVAVGRKTPVSPGLYQSGVSSPASGLSLSSLDLQDKRSHSFQAASAAYRKGGLLRGAAAVYADRGRELTQDMHYARSSEAAAYVDQRSRPDHIDLHGVRVHDGVNIALGRVRQWWDSLGEERVRKAKAGFTVVTGLGRHSAGGVSQLRVNVFKALVADGWKVQVLTGEMLVTGRK